MKGALLIVVLCGMCLAGRAMNIRLQAHVTPGTTGLPAASSVQCIQLNSSLALTGDVPQWGSGTVATTLDSVNGVYYCDLPAADFHNYQFVHTGTAIPLTRVSAKYNDGLSGCAQGTEVTLVKATSGQPTLIQLGAGGWWQYKAGGYSSAYTAFPVKFDVDECFPGTVTATLVRADGSTVSRTTTFAAKSGFVSTTASLDFGATNRQIKALRIAYSGSQASNTCRLVRARVQTQTTPANDPTRPNYTCFYRSHPVNILGLLKDGYFPTNPSSYLLLTNTVPEVEFSCVINYNFC